MRCKIVIEKHLSCLVDSCYFRLAVYITRLQTYVSNSYIASGGTEEDSLRFPNVVINWTDFSIRANGRTLPLFRNEAV